MRRWPYHDGMRWIAAIGAVLVMALMIAGECRRPATAQAQTVEVGR